MPGTVLHIQKVAGIAGSENHLLTLLPRLEEHGLRTAMLVLADREDRPRPFIERMRSRGIHVALLPMRADADPFLVVELVRYLRRSRFDIVHTHLYHADLYGAAAAGPAGIRGLVSTKHGFNPWRARPFHAFLDRMAAVRQRRIITISHALGRWLNDVEGLPDPKMEVIHYALDLDEFTAGNRGGRIRISNRPRITGSSSPHADLSRPVVGAVTRLLRQKGVHVLLEAFAACLNRCPHASLLVAGDGPARRDLENLAASLGISRQVRFLGHIAHSRVYPLMKTFDIFAFPTFGEGFGLVLLEAMACSLPVVASKVMAIPEIVLDGETGLLAPPDDPALLADALSRLMQNGDMREQMGRAGRRRVETAFSVERMVGQTVKIYEEALTMTRSAGSRREKIRKDMAGGLWG